MLVSTPNGLAAVSDNVRVQVRLARLIVATDGHSAEVAALCARVLNELDTTSQSAPEDVDQPSDACRDRRIHTPLAEN